MRTDNYKLDLPNFNFLFDHNKSTTKKEKRKEMKVAIFDFDGTIVYSENLWIHTFDSFEEEYDLPKTPFEKRMKQMTGSVLALATEYYNENEKIRTLFHSPQELAMYFNNQTEKRVHQQHPIEGVVEFISELHKRKIPVIIASSGRKEHIIEYLNQWNIHVDDVVTGIDVEHPKPAVDIYVEAMKRSQIEHISPSDCVVFEDNPQPALNASLVGFKTCLIKYHNHTIFSQSFDFATIIVSDFIDILSQINHL